LIAIIAFPFEIETIFEKSSYEMTADETTSAAVCITLPSIDAPGF
jgi:hypothetical protein